MTSIYYEKTENVTIHAPDCVILIYEDSGTVDLQNIGYLYMYGEQYWIKEWCRCTEDKHTEVILVKIDSTEGLK